MCVSLSLGVFLVSERAEPQMTIPEIGIPHDNLTTASDPGRISRPRLTRVLIVSLVSEKGQPLAVQEASQAIQTWFWHKCLCFPV